MSKSADRGVSAQVDAWVAAHVDEVVEWRRHLHQYPELSHMEYATTDYLCGILSAHGLNPRRFPGTGLYVDIGPATDQRLGFRVDIDALPMTEATGLEYSSQHPGVMHSCGHDVHTAIGLGLACALAEADMGQGVRIIFQPAEEVLDGGAPEVIAHGALDSVSALFAVHAEPKVKVGLIGVRAGAITSATDLVTVHVTGPGGHTSRPHLSSDVVYALGKIVTDLPGLLSRRVDPRTGTVMVFGSLNAGHAPNAIPEKGTVSGTLRTADIATWRIIRPLLEELIGQIVAPTGCSYSIDYLRGVPPVVNDDVATALLAEAARGIDPHAVVQAPQSSGGEDFSWYLEHVPGCMARLGCWDGRGKPKDLHQADLVVDERCLSVGIRLFGAIAERYAGLSLRG